MDTSNQPKKIGIVGIGAGRSSVMTDRIARFLAQKEMVHAQEPVKVFKTGFEVEDAPQRGIDIHPHVFVGIGHKSPDILEHLQATTATAEPIKRQVVANEAISNGTVLKIKDGTISAVPLSEIRSENMVQGNAGQRHQQYIQEFGGHNLKLVNAKHVTAERPRKVLPNGVKRFEIDGVAVHAINETNARRKAAKIKKLDR